MSIIIKVERELDEKFVGDVLVTAFDGTYGACFYWCHTAGTPTQPAVSIDKEDNWTHVRIRDEGDRQTLHTVSADIIQKGIQRILDRSLRRGDVAPSIRDYIMRGVLEADAGDIDAIAADCIVQAGLFNEVVYG